VPYGVIIPYLLSAVSMCAVSRQHMDIFPIYIRHMHMMTRVCTHDVYMLHPMCPYDSTYGMHIASYTIGIDIAICMYYANMID
jgi:hypothetical protein